MAKCGVVFCEPDRPVKFIKITESGQIGQTRILIFLIKIFVILHVSRYCVKFSEEVESMGSLKL